MNGLAFEVCPTKWGTRTRWERICLKDCDPFQTLSIMGDNPVELAIDLTDVTFCGAGQLDRAGDHRIEHGLNLCRRACDDTEHFARSGLLLQSLGELAS
jgi:hypothetical protein